MCMCEVLNFESSSAEQSESCGERDGEFGGTKKWSCWVSELGERIDETEEQTLPEVHVSIRGHVKVTEFWNSVATSVLILLGQCKSSSTSLPLSHFFFFLSTILSDLPCYRRVVLNLSSDCGSIEGLLCVNQTSVRIIWWKKKNSMGINNVLFLHAVYFGVAHHEARCFLSSLTSGVRLQYFDWECGEKPLQ